MEFKEYKGEIIVGITLIILLFLLINPFSVVMFSKTSMLILGITIAGIIFFTSLILSEKTWDERERHRFFAVGNIGYFSGVAVLTVGIALQSFQHSLDTWLGAALIAMVLGRVVASMYYKHKH